MASITRYKNVSHKDVVAWLQKCGGKIDECHYGLPTILVDGNLFLYRNDVEFGAGWISPMCLIHMCLVHQRNVAMHGKYLMIICTKIGGGE